MRLSTRFISLVFSGFIACTVSAQNAPVQELVRPSQADPSVQQFDEPDVVLTSSAMSGNVPLAIFLPGTHGKPMNALRLMSVMQGRATASSV